MAVASAMGEAYDQSPDRMTRNDWVAQAALVLRRSCEALQKADRRFLAAFTAYYTVPSDSYLSGIKNQYCLYCAELLREDGRNIDRWYLTDVVRHWAGMKPEHADTRWAQHLGVNVTTLWRWRNRPYKSLMPVTNTLDHWLEVATTIADGNLPDGLTSFD